ncbi:MAG: acetyl-CoA carboxylase biotin carboxyl carrier protein subunit, partial [Asticcacaulis sp.]
DLRQPWPDASEPSSADPSSPWNDPGGWWLNLAPRAPLYLADSSGGHATEASGTVIAPMPGKVIDVFVKPGEAVEKGQKLLILSAMKIEHTMKAPRAGTVTAVHAATEQQVADKAVLIEIES